MPTVLSRKPGGSGGGGAPSGPAGGSLGGTYPDPTIAANAIGTSELADNAVDTGAIAANAVTQAKMESGLFVPDRVVNLTADGTGGSLDPGAASIPSGYNVCEVFILARTAQAAVQSNIIVRVNNDSGANYDLQYVQGADATASSAASLGATSWSLVVPGASAQAGAVAAYRLTIPFYTDTVLHKTAEITGGFGEDTAADNRARALVARFRGTAAITELRISSGSGNLAAGSRLLIYVR